VGVDMPLKSGLCGWDGLAGPSGRILGSVEINRSISAGEHSVTPRFVLRMKKRSKQEQNSAALCEWERARSCVAHGTVRAAARETSAVHDWVPGGGALQQTGRR
jgi:hypothetical protein